MRYVFLLAAGISMFACNTPSSKPSADAQSGAHSSGSNSGVNALTEDKLYDKQLVLGVVNASGGKNRSADQYFLQGVDMYRNNKNVESAVKLFKQSIMTQPQARAYFELGNALADQDNLGDAASAYQMAELLDYKPTSKVLYNLACVYSRAEDTRSALYYLVSAIEFGYSNLKNINSDKDLAFVRSHEYEFNRSVSLAMSGATDPDKLQWNLFWHEFKPVSYPLVLDEKYGSKLGEDYISYEYERFVAEMRDNAKFSREVGYEFYHVGLAKNADSIKTLIYAVKNVIMGEGASPEYFIVSFDHYGKLIDKLQIGGQRKLSDPFRVATLTENGNIEIGLFKKVYEKNPEEEGFEDNKLVENKFLEKQYYSITSDGHFQKKDQLLGMNL